MYIAVLFIFIFFFFKQKTAYEMRISDWSSDVCSSDLPGVPRFVVVGLPDKAVGESRERVRAAIAAIGLSLPPKVITVNLSPADLPKEGSHYDLPIAIALLGAMGVIAPETLAHSVVVGEIGPAGRVEPSPGLVLRSEARQRGKERGST